MWYFDKSLSSSIQEHISSLISPYTDILFAYFSSGSLSGSSGRPFPRPPSIIFTGRSRLCSVALVLSGVVSIDELIQLILPAEKRSHLCSSPEKSVATSHIRFDDVKFRVSAMALIKFSILCRSLHFTSFSEITGTASMHIFPFSFVTVCFVSYLECRLSLVSVSDTSAKDESDFARFAVKADDRANTGSSADSTSFLLQLSYSERFACQLR